MHRVSGERLLWAASSLAGLLLTGQYQLLDGRWTGYLLLFPSVNPLTLTPERGREAVTMFVANKSKLPDAEWSFKNWDFFQQMTIWLWLF